MKILLSVVLLAGAALGQGSSGAISGPVLGLVFDPAGGTIRPLTGIPAAATIGSPLPGAGVTQASVSGESGYAIARDAESGDLVVMSASGRRNLPTVAGGANAVVSPRGSAAAVYSADPAVAQIFTGMPDAPQLVWQADLGAAPLAVAVSDDGSAFVAVLRQGRTEQVAVLYHAGVAPQILVFDRRFSDVQFVPGTSDVLVAASGRLLLISPTATEVLADERSGGRNIAAVGASTDGSKIVAATSAGRITIFDRRTNSQSLVPCACTVTGLSRLRGNAVFRLNEMNHGPMWILDADSPEARVVFVAAGLGDQQ